MPLRIFSPFAIVKAVVAWVGHSFTLRTFQLYFVESSSRCSVTSST